jgi:hypothetical protein
MHKLKVMNNLTALGAFLPKSLRHFPFLISRELQGWLLEDGHIFDLRTDSLSNGRRANKTPGDVWDVLGGCRPR